MIMIAKKKGDKEGMKESISGNNTKMINIACTSFFFFSLFVFFRALTTCEKFLFTEYMIN